MQAWWELEHCK